MRGDIYRIPALKDTRGHEQRGRRYAIMVQSDALTLSTALVVPTTTGSFPAWFHPEIEINGQRCYALIEQMRGVDVERLGAFAGRLDTEELARLSLGIRDALDLLG